VTPTARTLKYLRDLGYTAAVTEHWNAHIMRRQDLFGFVDIIAFQEGEVIFVQATSGSNTSARVHKIEANKHAQRWLECGNRILVIGWRQMVAYNKDGQKAKRKKWEPKIVEVI